MGSIFRRHTKENTQGRSPHYCEERVSDVALTSRRFCRPSVAVHCSQEGYKKIAREWQSPELAQVKSASNVFVGEKRRPQKRENAWARSLFICHSREDDVGVGDILLKMAESVHFRSSGSSSNSVWSMTTLRGSPETRALFRHVDFGWFGRPALSDVLRTAQAIDEKTVL